MPAQTQPNLAQHGNRWRTAAWTGAGLLLLLPLIAMQFTHEVAWDGTDFATFGAMLLVFGGAYELTVRMTRNTIYRAVIGAALAALFLLVWAELAVGIFR